MDRRRRAVAGLRRAPLPAVVGVAGLLAGTLAAALVAGGDSDDAQTRATEPRPAPARTAPAEVRFVGPATTREEEPAEKPGKPRPFRATNTSVKRLVHEQLGERARSGQPRVSELRCARGRCLVRYISDSRGFGRQRSDQQEILERLFADPRIREVELLAHHQTAGRHKDERLPILEVTCDRAAFRANTCTVGKRTGRHREAPHSLPKPGEPTPVEGG